MILNTYKIQGQTTASAPINTVNIEHWDNGTIRVIQVGKPPVTINDVNGLRLIGLLIGKKFPGYPA